MRCQCEHFDLSHRTSRLRERFAEHGDQRGAVDDGGALKRGRDNGGAGKAQSHSDCTGQSAFCAGEHAEEFSGFHDVVPLFCLHGVVAMERNVERHQKPRDGHATKCGWNARNVENAREMKTGADEIGQIYAHSWPKYAGNPKISSASRLRSVPRY